jgi:hypothetical protein
MDLFWLKKRRKAQTRLDRDAKEIRELFGDGAALEAARRAKAYRQPSANLREARHWRRVSLRLAWGG